MCVKNSRDEYKKTVAQGKLANEISMKRIVEGTPSVNKVNISRNYQTEMKLRQNMTELEHEEWSQKQKSYVKSSLPAEPKLDIKMCVDVPVYKQHRPPLTCLMTQYRNGVDQGKRKPGTAWNQGASFSTTADTGAQVNILGVNHIQKLGLKVNCLLKTKMVVNCANDTPGDILGVFYARIKAKHRTTGKNILLKSMVYVMEGSSILLSRKTLQDFGCIPPDFPQAGQFKNANLAHMQSSKEGGLSLTQERADQGLPYQL